MTHVEKLEGKGNENLFLMAFVIAYVKIAVIVISSMVELKDSIQRCLNGNLPKTVSAFVGRLSGELVGGGNLYPFG